MRTVDLSLSPVQITLIKRSRVVLMCGLPGSGKSTLARRISLFLGAELVVSDKIREEVFNSPRYEAGDEAVHALREKYYSLVFARAQAFLSDGKSVVIDATNMDKQRLILIKKLAELLGRQKLLLVVVKTPKEIIAKRMKSQAKMVNQNETEYEAWQRVYGYFLKHIKNGDYFWPQPSEGVPIIYLNNGKQKLTS